ncbi:MAG: hypothetical protein WCR42_00275 [bacterium]
MKRIYQAILVLLALTIILPLVTKAQGGDKAFQNKLESVLSQFKNYRFSTISVYKISEIGEIRKLMKKQESIQASAALGAVGGGADIEALKKKVGEDVYNYINEQAKAGQSQRAIASGIDQRGWKIPEDTDLRDIYLASKTVGTEKKLQYVYAITTRIGPDKTMPSTIIAVMTVDEDEDQLKEQLNNIGAKKIFTYPELKQEFDDNLKSEFGVNDFYELVLNAFRQGNVEDVTLEAQGIGTDIMFAAPKAGNAAPIIRSESDISGTDIQSFLRVSNGDPEDITMKKNEVILSPDLISWKSYDYMIVDNDGVKDTLSPITNINMPNIGIELRYGIDDLNIPSLFSERLSANFIWKNMKLGAILPTNGWSQLSTSLYKQDRKLTYAGLGINAQADFPIAIVPKSGIFSFKGSYVSGDAQPASYNDGFRKDLGGYDTQGNLITSDPVRDYLIRYTAQLHYTFGIALDEDYLLRFGLGAGMYGAETWFYDVNVDASDAVVINYKMLENEMVGGISGRVDFMVKNIVTPWGISMQYFDEAITGDIWLQIPIVKNTFSVRLDGKAYVKVIENDLRPWEPKNIVIPNVRFVMFF